MLKEHTGVDLLHAPYQGSAHASADLLGGRFLDVGIELKSSSSPEEFGAFIASENKNGKVSSSKGLID